MDAAAIVIAIVRCLTVAPHLMSTWSLISCLCKWWCLCPCLNVGSTGVHRRFVWISRWWRASCLMRKCETGKQQKRIGMRCETYIEEKTRVTKRASCWVWFHYICLPDGNRRSRQWRWDLIEIEWRVATNQRRKGQQSSLGILVGRSVGLARLCPYLFSADWWHDEQAAAIVGTVSRPDNL